MGGVITHIPIAMTNDPDPGDSEPPARAGSMAGQVPIRVELADSTGGVPTGVLRWIEERSRSAAGHLGLGGVLRVTLVDDQRMGEAHQRHCGEPGTTDVITFDYSVGSEGAGAGGAGGPGVLDADLLVCVDEAHRQSAKRGLRVEYELLLYIVHGVLHCLGHDDHEEADAGAMHRREDDVFRAIGLPPTYSAPERG